MDDLAAERVLRAVECIPPGSVAAYGDVAKAAGASARFAARVMSTYGGGVAWWRVPNARGALPPGLLAEALPRWRAEGTPLTGTGGADLRVDMRAARMDPDELARTAQAVAADLDELDGRNDLDDLEPLR